MCIFKLITGLPCPGCGMTRAFLHFFHGDLQGAFYYHPLFWLVPLLFGILVLRKVQLFEKWRQSNRFWLGVLTIVVGVYVIRLALYFPNQAPLDFDTQALLPRLFTAIFQR